MSTSLFCLTILLVPVASERDYVEALATERGNEYEVRMPDGTYCDIVSDNRAIEVDWARKWQESIGQATLYSVWTGKEGAVILLVESWRDDKLHILRAKLVCLELGIPLEIIHIQDITLIPQ